MYLAVDEPFHLVVVAKTNPSQLRFGASGRSLTSAEPPPRTKSDDHENDDADRAVHHLLLIPSPHASGRLVDLPRENRSFSSPRVDAP